LPLGYRNRRLNKIERAVFIVFSLIAAVYLIHTFKKLSERQAQHLPFTYTIPDDLWQLFNKDNVDSFAVTEVWNSNNKQLKIGE
jgi:hypothetical protein